ncbi:hypothetical protein AAHK20_04340 [Trinickia sp. YCB016]
MLLIVCFIDQGNAVEQCTERQVVTANLPNIVDGQARAIACGDSDNTGVISISIVVNGKEREELRASYDGSAYVLVLDTAIKFGEGNSQGLGVSTGKGRDGNGMHYWKISSTRVSVVDLGEAPELQPDKFVRGAYSALVSSTGTYRATRYFYELRGGRLIPTKAVGFSDVDDKTVTAVMMDLLPSNETVTKRRRTMSIRRATSCMNGESSCW